MHSVVQAEFFDWDLWSCLPAPAQTMEHPSSLQRTKWVLLFKPHSILTPSSNKEHRQNSPFSLAENGYQRYQVPGTGTRLSKSLFRVLWADNGIFKERDRVAAKSACIPAAWGMEEEGNHVLQGMGRKRGRRRTRRERTKCQHLNWDTQRASS